MKLKVWSVDQSALGSTVLMNKISNEKFSFDKIYGDSITTEQIYNDQYRPMVTKCMKGFNMTVLAYGQTASGKTYTMHGSSNDDIPDNRKKSQIGSKSLSKSCFTFDHKVL